MVKAKIKTVSRLTNASALARELGVTREHLWRVVTGRRESRRLAAQLRQRGVKVAKGSSFANQSAKAHCAAAEATEDKGGK